MRPILPTAAAYHRATSYHRHRLTPHTLDWAHQPRLTKTYPGCTRVPLDPDPALPAIDFFSLCRQAAVDNGRPTPPVDLKTLSALLHLTQAVTGRSMHGGQPFYYRSVASAGALYPFEIYLAAHRIAGLTPGVYHHDLFDGALTRLRHDPIPVDPSVNGPVAATVYITGIFFRSAWKYRRRAYRYLLLDAGHLLENLRLALTALQLAFSVHLDFDDAGIAHLLGLNPDQEVCLIAVHLPAGPGSVPVPEALGAPPPLAERLLTAATVSAREVAYPDILGIHRAGNTSDVGTDGSDAALHLFQNPPASWTDLPPPVPPAAADYVDVLRRRRSRRNFIASVAAGDDFMTFLHAVAGGPIIFGQALRVGLLTGSAMPVQAGVYLLDPDGRRLGRMSAGDLMNSMAAACLDQMWLKQAGLHLLFMTDPQALDRRWGARGYRYAMIAAGQLGQRAYLCATALGWGACGIGAIYDREAAQLLHLTADGSLLYLVAVGPVKGR
jgi:SagB-type dehydrogenase family enzyme